MITTIINYCTNDYRYLPFTLEQAKKFSDHLIVVCGDHFFDGQKENRHLLDLTYHNHPDVTFIEYAFDTKSPYGLYPRFRDDDPKGVQYWHSTSRYIGYHYLPSESDFVLFLDADEVADGEAMKRWLNTGEYKRLDAVRFVCYFYFRSARQRATKETRCGLLVRRSALQAETLLDVHERRGTFLSIRGDRLEDVRGLDGKPLFHHYSWVKTKGEAFRKVQTWGHKNDRAWDQEIEREFSVKGVKENIYHLNYEFVAPFCDPLSIKIPRKKVSGPFPNVKLTVPSKVLQRSVAQMLGET